MDIKFWRNISQRDTAWLHTINAVFDMLNENSNNRVSSNCFSEKFIYSCSWSPYSPDLNPCDCLLFDFLQDTLYTNNQHTIKKLLQEISVVVTSINEETLVAIVQNFRCQLQLVLDASGAYTENVFT
jgi:hypothetical protein